MKRNLSSSLLFAPILLAWGCSTEAQFASAKRLASNGADATATDSSADAFGDRTQSQIDDLSGGAWEPFSFTRTLNLVDRQDVSADIRPAFGLVDETVQMKVAPESQAGFRQIVRNDVTNSFRQGHDGVVRTETFPVSKAGLLDILVVVDNSTSMAEEQQNLAEKLEALTNDVDDTNWQIGVINMSTPCLRLNRLIKRSDADRVDAFRQAASVGMNNGVIEKGYPMAIRALKGECNGRYNPWIRQGSTVAVLVVSDEDNCGSNNGPNSCALDYGKNATEMIQFLRQIRPADKAKLYGIHWIPNDKSCRTALGEAWKYQEGINLTGGYAGSICDADYTTTLQKIARDVRKSVVKEFTLSDSPDMRVVEISVDGQNLGSGYTINGNKVVLDQASSDGKTMLVVTYSYGGVAKFDSVTLTKTPDDGTISVTVDGAEVDSSGWTFDPATRVLTFGSRPADRAAIDVRYKEKVSWRSSFALGRADVVGGSVRVAVNGSVATGWTFDARTGTVAFDVPPPEGASIAVNYRMNPDFTTTYAASVSQLDKVKSVTAVDASTGVPVAVNLSGNSVVFDRADVQPGRVVVVSYDYGEDTEDQTWELASMPEEGSFKLEANPPGACTSDVRVDGKTLHFRCAPGDRASLHIEYKTITARHGSFDVSPETGVDDSRIRLQKIDVKVDDVETSDYHLAAGRLTFGAATVAKAKGEAVVSASGVRRRTP
ncbi:hypothetical protein EBZ80_04540 [bacterium]|nr:hypothetical protein [bacterium]